MNTSRAVGLAAILAVALSGGSALAFSGGGNSNAGAQTPSCRSGFVYDGQSGQCVQNTARVVDDKSLYQTGRNLALAGRYREALTTLGAVRHKDAMTLTMIGYSQREMGQYKQAMASYSKALALEPNNLNTHEYLGEAYVKLGRADLAKAELNTLKKLCGTGCEQYRDLAAAVSSH